MRSVSIVLSVFVILLCIALGRMLSRIDSNNAALAIQTGRIDNSNETIAELRKSIASIDMQRYDGELESCEQRTENLHQVLYNLILDGTRWPERRALPDPPPPWRPWPTRARLNEMDKQYGETER